MKAAPPTAAVDAQNPWLGLVSFTEETRGYFHGREEEAAELSRRVQRKLLTVLFGQSGLGKTSILQAGLVPRLRPDGYCPVYVRLDYNPHAPSPSEQIKRAMFQETKAAGTWTQSGSAVEGETLWEFLHHRDDVLKDAGGRVLTPILIFDQFEEIFTLAQSDDAGRKKAQEFLADLADLVENRPPAALEARIDRDEADASRFDFTRADYRILISLREDYLAHLEGLKAQMPSVTQNRMRLARMGGAQAVAAVRAPAPELVSEAVAESVVRFVAGGADLARAEVEPSLLSLICRELNNQRVAQGRAEISADLLEGSRDTILTEFYERALVGQPEGVREFIEDKMLTDSGFRESVAEERVRKGFAAAGAAPDALATLVNRRLLRVEDRLDLRRVEITHDVLCSVIAASRRVRHERQALEESKRQLEIQKVREAAAQRSLVRARKVAVVSATLMVIAAASAVFGWVSLRRARAAEVKTQHARELTERARGDAEKLVGFLLEDFYEELLPTGQVEIVGNLADKAVAYYDNLPPELVTVQTRIYRGMALDRKADALAVAGDTVAAVNVSDKARVVFESLRAEGDKGEATSLGLALALMTMTTAGFTHMDKDQLELACNLLRPFVASGHASRASKLALADMLQYISFEVSPEEGIARCEEGRKILADMGALRMEDLSASSIYGDVSDTESRICLSLGRYDDAQRIALLEADVADKVLALRPGDLRAMRDRFQAPDALARVAVAREDPHAAEAFQRKAVEAAREYTMFNPSDSVGWLSMSVSSNQVAAALMSQGKVSEAIQQWRATTEFEKDPRNKTGSSGNVYYSWRNIARYEAERGNLGEAEKALSELHATTENFKKTQGVDEAFTQASDGWESLYRLDILASKGDYGAIAAQAAALDERLQKIATKNSLTKTIKEEALRQDHVWIVEAAIRTGSKEQALSAAKGLMEVPETLSTDEKQTTDLIKEIAETRYGEALIENGRKGEARGLLAEAVAYFHQRQANGAADTRFRQEFGKALYEMARAQEDDDIGRAHRRDLLNEAQSILGGLSQEAQQFRTSRELIEKVSVARAGA
ncbi:MAG TPA: hypothetical protein VFE25_09475 [Opitutaceae bacterium]|nr:hypothetical protein [Opitutaceae bacterium]